MCGISGIWGAVHHKAIEKMVAAMLHRGPDDSGFYSDYRISLGMARLAIIDLHPTGHQPMSNAEKTVWIIYNGEMYNFMEQRSHLEKLGCRFNSTSDTEVVLQLYERYGDDFLLHIRGMFALAIYDKRKGPGRERLLLARDQLGIKPLLYAQVNGKLVFASEIKALLASELMEREIDPVALRQLLTFGSVYQPLTMIRGVKMLMPGERMILENSQPRLERYWSLSLNRIPELRTLPYEEQVQALSEVLAKSVRRQMVSDVPLGAFLSGGIDSSLLVALMAREKGRQVRTFSVGFAGEGNEIDESGDAELTARFLGTEHSHVTVRGTDVAQHILRIAAGLDQPSVDGVNSYFISLAARQGLTVAVSGTGSDELFAGYPWFANMMAEEKRQVPFWAKLLSALACQPVFDNLLRTRLQYQVFRARTLAGFLNRFAQQYRIFGSAAAATMIAPGLRHQACAGRAEFYDLQPCDILADAPVIERVTGLCLHGYTLNQLLRDMDATSMAHSLEVRVPYLDTEVVDMALSLPSESKLVPVPTHAPGDSYRAAGVKRILLDVARLLLPGDFDLRRKRGFAMPFAKWLQGPLNNVLLDSLSETSTRKRGWLDPAAVTLIREEFTAGRSGWARPWLLMMLELWARQVLDRVEG
jgi:asparagine synthase (glutamine-hydrolysing)